MMCRILGVKSPHFSEKTEKTTDTFSGSKRVPLPYIPRVLANSYLSRRTSSTSIISLESRTMCLSDNDEP
jgi:hypothetical protein